MPFRLVTPGYQDNGPSGPNDGRRLIGNVWYALEAHYWGRPRVARSPLSQNYRLAALDVEGLRAAACNAATTACGRQLKAD